MNSLFRKLYGYDTHSNYNRYNKRKKGMLGEILSIRYEKGIIMIRETNLEKVKDMIRECGVDYGMWKVIPGDEEMYLLKL